MEGQKRHWYILWLLSFLLTILTGCAFKEESNDYVYVAEKLMMSGARDFKVKEGYFYYKQEGVVYRLPIEALAEEENIYSFREIVFAGNTEGGSLYSYTPDSMGGGYYALSERLWTGEICWSALVRIQADGTESYRLDLGERDISGISLAADGKGRAFLLIGDFLYVVGAEGKLIAQIEGSKLGAEFYSGRGSLLEGEDGSVYYVPFSSAANIVYEVLGDDAAFRREAFRMKRIELPGKINRCYSAQQGLLCSGNDGMLYQYRKEEGQWEMLLRFGDSNLKWQPDQMLQLSENFMAAFYDSPDNELYLLTRTNASLLPEQKELVLVLTGQLLPDVEKYIVEFNRNSGYHITIEYSGGPNLDAMMLSSDPPDLLLYTDNEDMLRYAQKGMLEDLGAYLDASTMLDRENFLENIIEAYTINGRLVCIPKGFEIRTALGRTTQLGTEAGWTTEEAMAFAEAHLEEQLFKTPTFTSMVAFFWEAILDSYVDWESGECSFDGNEFCNFVKWMEEYSSGFGNGYTGSTSDSFDSPMKRIPENQLLCLESYIYDFEDLLRYEMCFGEKITAIGYPTYDGRIRHNAYVLNAMSITAKSKNKEAAWQFVEGYLAQEISDAPGMLQMLSTQKDHLMKKAAEKMEIVYQLDDNGEISLYKAGEQEGEPVMIEKGRMYFEGENIPYYYLSQEQVDTVLEIIKNIDFTPKREGTRHDVINILMEELAPYIEGHRSLEESTRILQNRVRNLVQENM